jgi:hypothetical protein
VVLGETEKIKAIVSETEKARQNLASARSTAGTAGDESAKVQGPLNEQVTAKRPRDRCSTCLGKELALALPAGGQGSNVVYILQDQKRSVRHAETALCTLGVSVSRLIGLNWVFGAEPDFNLRGILGGSRQAFGFLNR